MSRVHVDLKENSYDILIGSDTLPELGETIVKKNLGEKVIIITDPLVNELYGDAVRGSFKSSRLSIFTFEVPRGEKYKNLETASRLYNRLVEVEAQRDSTILALGGGVIGDLAGFVAATYMRGINLVQVPTTLLAQVDAAIGGKTAVNHPKCKNLIGVFHQPKLVFIDIKTLTTLAEKEIRNGLSEVIKYGVIEDEAFFKFIEANAHHLNTKAFEDKETLKAALKVWNIIVTESCKIKAKVVAADEKERGPRMVLNFGHTIGHAIEMLTKYKEYAHGETVAVGMACAASIAAKLKMLGEDSVQRIRELLEKLKLPVRIERLKAKRIIQALVIDKKVREGKVRFILPKKIGKVEIRDDVPVKVMRKTLKEFGAR